MLGLLITIVGLVVGRGRGVIGRGMVDYWGIGWSMVNSMVNSMVGNRGMVNSMVGNNWGSMNCMMNRGSMMDRVSTKCCKWNGRAASHKGDKSNQSKDLEYKLLLIQS
jgi:hypothetical protein